MLTVTVIICSLHSVIFSYEVPGQVIVGKEWIQAIDLGARFDRKQCWVETADTEDNNAVQ